MTTPVPSTEMLDALTQCAYRLGLAFGAEAERTQGKAMLEACERFDRCFFSVRMGIGYARPSLSVWRRKPGVSPPSAIPWNANPPTISSAPSPLNASATARPSGPAYPCC